MVQVVFGKPIPELGRADYTARLASQQGTPCVILQTNSNQYIVLHEYAYSLVAWPDATLIATWRKGVRLDSTRSNDGRTSRPDTPAGRHAGRSSTPITPTKRYVTPTPPSFGPLLPTRITPPSSH